MTQKKLKLIYNSIKDKKREIKSIREMYKTSLDNDKNYRSVVDEFNAMKLKKKEIEDKAKLEMASEFDKINTLKQEIIVDELRLSDIALSCLIKGEDINITDSYENEFEPVFKVKYKRV